MLFIISTLVRWRKLIIVAALGTAGLMALISLILPQWFMATTSVFPPDTQSSVPLYAADMMNLQIPILGPNAAGARPETIYIDILRSRRVGFQIIQEFELKKLWGIPLNEVALDKLHAKSRFSLMENGLLMISYEDKDPQRAAAVANRYVELLDEFNRAFNVGKAARSREFIERQISGRREDLHRAEEALRDFQEAHQTLELDEQIKASIEVVAGLTAQAVALELELEGIKQYTSTDSEEYLRKKKELEAVNNQLAKFKMSSAHDDPDDQIRSFFPAFDEVPEMSLELARLVRQVTVEERVYQMLVEEYEKARIEEARDTPTVQVLDLASVPEQRSKPKRKTLVILGGVLGLAWSSLFAMFVGAWQEDKSRDGQVARVLGPLASDLRRLFRRKRQ